MLCEINRRLDNNSLSGNVPVINSATLTRFTWYCFCFSHYRIFFLGMTFCCCVVVSLQCAAKQLLGAFLSHHNWPILSCLLFSFLRMNHHRGARSAVARRSCPPQPACSLRKPTRWRMCCTSQRQSHCRYCWQDVGDDEYDDNDDVGDDDGDYDVNACFDVNDRQWNNNNNAYDDVVDQ